MVSLIMLSSRQSH